MNDKNVSVVIKYILNNGNQIESDKITRLHQFPLGLLAGEMKNRAIQNVIERAKPNSTVTLEIHENGTLKDNIT